MRKRRRLSEAPGKHGFMSSLYNDVPLTRTMNPSTCTRQVGQHVAKYLCMKPRLLLSYMSRSANVLADMKLPLIQLDRGRMQ
jgi:hypothetical protein